jgi:hypothetical protein
MTDLAFLFSALFCQIWHSYFSNADQLASLRISLNCVLERFDVQVLDKMRFDKSKVELFIDLFLDKVMNWYVVNCSWFAAALNLLSFMHRLLQHQVDWNMYEIWLNYSGGMADERGS